MVPIWTAGWFFLHEPFFVSGETWQNVSEKFSNDDKADSISEPRSSPKYCCELSQNMNYPFMQIDNCVKILKNELTELESISILQTTMS